MSRHGWTHGDPGNDGLAIEATPRIAASQLAWARVFYSSGGNSRIGGRDVAHLDAPPPGNAMFSPPCSGVWQINQHQLDQVGNGHLVMLCVRSSGSASIYSSPLAGSNWTPVAGTSVTGQPSGLRGESLFVTAPTATTTGYVVQDTGNLWTIYPPRHPRQQLIGWTVVPVAVSHNGGGLLTFACPPAPATCARPIPARAGNGRSSSRTSPAFDSMSTTGSTSVRTAAAFTAALSQPTTR